MTDHTPKPPAIPKDAAAMILLRNADDTKVFLVKRSRTLAFMANYYAFPGGQRDPADAETPILNGKGIDDEMRVVAIRELFEETGVLVARGVENLAPGKLISLRHELVSEQASFKDLLVREGLALDADLLVEAPRWVTPAHSPRRYNTRFYAAWLPEGQETEVIPGELEKGEWLRPQEAIQRWIDGDCIIVTPIVFALKALADGADNFTGRMRKVSQEELDHLESRIEMCYGFFLCPLRTPTLPPATHTNCYLVGGDELVIVDPGSPYPDQQEILDEAIRRFLAQGRTLREIIITHLHPDHIGGVMHLSDRFKLPVAAHRLTAEAIKDEVRVDRLIEDGELIELNESSTGITWRLRAMWTPGHARGHLSLYEERTGVLLTGDCVVGFGTVVIAPPEGEMRDYLDSLRKFLELPRLTALMPGHGPVLVDGRGKIEEYIAHRLDREGQIVAVMKRGERAIPAIVKSVYKDLPEALHNLAEMSVLAHLEKLVADGLVVRSGEDFELFDDPRKRF
jgi:glyoxylase-like metal-dependent hydrolase (beta-lactamase superfamily II)/8-oxo-dGTP pyrophosphatase MutT (NUDIX family)